MSQLQPFFPNFAKTVELAVSAVTGNVPISRGSVGDASQQLRVANIGTKTCWIEFGSTSVAATLPAGATPGSMPLLAGTSEIYTVPAASCTNVAAICTGADTTTLHVTSGNGGR